MPGSGFAKSWDRDPPDDDVDNEDDEVDGAPLGQLGLVQLGLGHCLVIEVGTEFGEDLKARLI